MYFFGKKLCVSLDEIVNSNYRRSRLEEHLQDQYSIERRLIQEQKKINDSLEKIAELNAKKKTMQKTYAIYSMRGI